MVTRQIHTECTRRDVGNAREEGAIKRGRGLRTSRQREAAQGPPLSTHTPVSPALLYRAGLDWPGCGFQPAAGALVARPSDLFQLYLQDSPAKLSHPFGERGHHRSQKGLGLSNAADPPPVKDRGKDFAGATKRKKNGGKKKRKKIITIIKKKTQ